MNSEVVRPPVLPPLLRIGDRALTALARLDFEYQLADMVWGHARAHQVRKLPEDIHCAQWSTNRSSGDFAIAVEGPAKTKRLLVGDMTGRGLAAALAAYPVCEAFYTEAAREADAFDVLRRLNAAVSTHVPRGFFCAATFIEIDTDNGAFRLWNCGLPDALVLSSNGVARRFASVHPPLGVMADEELGGCERTDNINAGERLVIYTDGVLSASATKGAVFGASALEAALREAFFRDVDGKRLASSALDAVLEYCWPRLPTDDVTIVAVG
ncbi:MAG: serine phosphatase RsbU (regulator of sigma subunit) [Gammaproteobacteria bacterium]|jgi:serine phosphatase RsbU (regulator of sigma subunit)